MAEARQQAWLPEFQWQVVSLASACRPFYDRIGPFLKPEHFSDKAVAEVMRTVRAMAKGRESGPNDLVAVKQRLQQRVGEGKVPSEVMHKAAANLVPTDKLNWQIVLDIVKRDIQYDERKDAMMGFIKAATGGELDLSKAAEKVAAVNEIGKEPAAVGTIAIDGLAIQQGRYAITQSPIGIREVDAAFGGKGPLCPGLLTWGGRDKSGKSMALTSGAARDFAAGELVVVASLELPVRQQEMRVFAALAQAPISMMRAGDLHTLRQVDDAVAKAVSDGGGLVVQEFLGQNATLAVIKRWIDRVEQETGRKVARVYLDYAGRLHEPAARDQYTAKERIWQGLSDMAHVEGRFVATAQQGTRGMSKATDKHAAPLMTAGDFADSQHIVRITDHAITINPRPDKTATMFICTDRHFGAGGTLIGPYPTAYDIGHIFSPAMMENYDDLDVDMDMFPDLH